MGNKNGIKILEIREVTQADNEEIQKCYPDETEGHIRVGDKGYLFPARYREGLHLVANFPVRHDDVFVVTFPRSGTTWTQELVWLVANNLDFETAKQIPLTHRYTVLEFFMYIRNSKKEELKKVYSNDETKLNMLDAITTFPGDFLNSAMWSPIFEHVKEAWNLRHHPNMLFLFYEELAQDLPSVIRRVSEFLGKIYDEEQINALHNHLTFENFKKNRAVHLADFEDLGILSEPDNFIRKGKVGGWREYFDDEMKRQADEWITDNLRGTDLKFP